jgi:hypothetical protein
MNLSCTRFLKTFGHYHAWWLILFLVIAASCGKREKQEALFYPIDSLVDHQIKHLKAAQASLKKTAMLGDKTDVKNLSPQRSAGDTIPWIHELSIFREINIINKPANEGGYVVDHELTDLRSNLKVRAFTALDPDSTSNGEILPVRYLRIYYQGSIENVRRIEAEMDIKTSLYQSARFLQMEFQDINDTVVLTGYTVSGGQKMYLGDTVQYKVEGLITLPN